MIKEEEKIHVLLYQAALNGLSISGVCTSRPDTDVGHHISEIVATGV
jgi:hypothetical protein